jgi:hypothetical protein
MHVKQLRVYLCFIFQLSRVEMCFCDDDSLLGYSAIWYHF